MLGPRMPEESTLSWLIRETAAFMNAKANDTVVVGGQIRILYINLAIEQTIREGFEVAAGNQSREVWHRRFDELDGPVIGFPAAWGNGVFRSDDTYLGSLISLVCSHYAAALEYLLTHDPAFGYLKDAHARRQKDRETLIHTHGRRTHSAPEQ